jgi:hypothetical protein
MRLEITPNVSVRVDARPVAAPRRSPPVASPAQIQTNLAQLDQLSARHAGDRHPRGGWSVVGVPATEPEEAGPATADEEHVVIHPLFFFSIS